MFKPYSFFKKKPFLLCSFESDDAAFQFVQKNPSIAAMALAMQTHTGFTHNDQIHYSVQGEAEIINRMLKNVTEDLCWLSRPFPFNCYKDFDKYDMINRLPKAYFSNKVFIYLFKLKFYRVPFIFIFFF